MHAYMYLYLYTYIHHTYIWTVPHIFIQLVYSSIYSFWRASRYQLCFLSTDSHTLIFWGSQVWPTWAMTVDGHFDGYLYWSHGDSQNPKGYLAGTRIRVRIHSSVDWSRTSHAGRRRWWLWSVWSSALLKCASDNILPNQSTGGWSTSPMSGSGATWDDPLFHCEFPQFCVGSCCIFIFSLKSRHGFEVSTPEAPATPLTPLRPAQRGKKSPGSIEVYTVEKRISELYDSIWYLYLYWK